MNMLRGLLLAAAIGLLALALSSSQTPAFAEQLADLAVTHTVSPPSQVDVNTGFLVPVILSERHFGPSTEVAEATRTYTLTGPVECGSFSLGPQDTFVSRGSTSGISVGPTFFCTTTGVKSFTSEAKFLPRGEVTDPDLNNNVHVIIFEILVVSPDPVINVTIDIKPGSDPNCVNTGGNGVIPVAILTTPTFNAAEVDPLTVTLLGGAIRLNGKSGNAGSLQDVDSDGDLDRVIQVIDFSLSTGETTAILSGITFGGTPIEGADAICVVP